MNYKKLFSKTNRVGFVLGAVLLATLAQGVGSANAQNVGRTITPPVVAPIVIPDNYVYYPNYGVYYNSHRRQYQYMKGNVWVAQQIPEGVSVAVLQASPRVDMDFHDSPARHHAEMLRKYPRGWKPSAAPKDQKEDQKNASPDHPQK